MPSSLPDDVGKKGFAKTSFPLNSLLVSRKNTAVISIIVKYILNIWVQARLKNFVLNYPSHSLSHFHNRNNSKTTYFFCTGLSMEFLRLTELQSFNRSNQTWLFPSHRQTYLKRLCVMVLHKTVSSFTISTKTPVSNAAQKILREAVL